MRTLRRLAVFAALVAIGCGGGGDDDGDGNPTGPGPGGGGGGGATNGTYSVSVNGTAWSATGSVTVSRQNNNFIGIAGTGFAGGTTYAIVVSIANATGPGNHSLSVFSGGDGSSVTIGTSAGLGYSTGLQGGSGTLTITSLTSNRIVGTFSGTAIAAGHSGANLVLTSGTFDLTF
jgi:hypothetical protein